MASLFIVFVRCVLFVYNCTFVRDLERVCLKLCCLVSVVCLIVFIVVSLLCVFVIVLSDSTMIHNDTHTF